MLDAAFKVQARELALPVSRRAVVQSCNIFRANDSPDLQPVFARVKRRDPELFSQKFLLRQFSAARARQFAHFASQFFP